MTELPEEVVTYLSTMKQLANLVAKQTKLREELNKLQPGIQKWLTLLPNAEINLIFSEDEEQYLGPSGKLMVKVDQRRENLGRKRIREFLGNFMSNEYDDPKRSIDVANRCMDHMWNSRALSKSEVIVSRTYTTRKSSVPRRVLAVDTNVNNPL